MINLCAFNSLMLTWVLGWLNFYNNLQFWLWNVLWFWFVTWEIIIIIIMQFIKRTYPLCRVLRALIDTIILTLVRRPFKCTSISKNNYFCQVPIYYTGVERGNLQFLIFDQKETTFCNSWTWFKPLSSCLVVCSLVSHIIYPGSSASHVIGKATLEVGPRRK